MIRQRQLWIGIGILVLLPILVPLVTVEGARTSILRSLQAGLGRGIHADAVHLRLFPLPGVELDQVRLAEDPAFGLEDMVVADDATAAVRLGPLFRGRLVFARIHLDHPSINLVRNRSGQWNIAALLERAGSLARSGQGGVLAPSLRFPYVEWSDARVNFKLDQTKTRFFLDQVQGSLARENGGWRLQARFQPQRTDLNLSDTGDVTVDGRWPAASDGSNYTHLPFDLVLRLQNSYLAGSSALLAGHDAGVHGILAAQVHIQSPGQRRTPGTPLAFRVTGALQAQSLRRWDLLPPPATVNAVFAGIYDPAQDRFELEGAGDPGWKHLRLQGDVAGLFTHPTADLTLSLHQFSASDLLPLVMAVKARLPAHLQADGLADGVAHLQWQRTASSQPSSPAPGLHGDARFSLDNFRLYADQEQLQLPSAIVAWDGRSLRLQPSSATVASGGGLPPVPVRLAAAVDRRGFQFQLESAALTPTAAQSLARLFGLRSPWPPALAGAARVRLGLASTWAGFRQTGWFGTALLPQAQVQLEGGGHLALRNVTVHFADPQPLEVDFTAVLADPSAAAGGDQNAVGGILRWASAATVPLQFDLHASQLQDGAVWRLLHPPPGDLVQRVFGDSTPGWIGHLHASGRIAITDLSWKGMHAGVVLQLQASPGLWQVSNLALAFAHGTFAGGGRLEHGDYQISGEAHDLRLAELFDSTPYRGLLAGQLSGSLQLTRPAGGQGWEGLEASGRFDIRRGLLSLAAGPRSFDRFSGAYNVHQGVADLSDLLWVESGERWQGQGTAALVGVHSSFDIQLRNRGRRLHLTGRLP